MLRQNMSTNSILTNNRRATKQKTVSKPCETWQNILHSVSTAEKLIKVGAYKRLNGFDGQAGYLSQDGYSARTDKAPGSGKVVSFEQYIRGSTRRNSTNTTANRDYRNMGGLDLR